MSTALLLVRATWPATRKHLATDAFLVAGLAGTLRGDSLVAGRRGRQFDQFRRLRVRYEKRADIHEEFLALGCALISWHLVRVD